mmetsp:Transcript_31914/g.71886  ORF Transcript_31914/g.71886 Transcript_31914/m.71886 type:complete len:167 (-) Transcript_31914:615-1115(-)
MQSGLLSGGLNGMKFAGICQEGPPALGALTGVARLYLSRCAAYGVHHPNAGVLTALRHGLRELRVAGGFTDHDMLPLADVLLAGGPLPKSGGAGQGNQVPRAAFSSAFSSGVSSSSEEEEEDSKAASSRRSRPSDTRSLCGLRPAGLLSHVVDNPPAGMVVVSAAV